MKAFKVIGVGLNKTGTTTLAECLQVLGYRKHVSVRRDLLASYRRGEMEPIFQVVEENESFEDWPYPLMYKELFFRFGERARYVLTRRKDAQAWLESLKRHSLRTTPDKHLRLLAYGYSYPHGAEAYHLDLYERHNRQVRDFFREQKAEHLLLELCWEEGDGWEKLCGFLNEPVPSAALPHANVGARPIPAEVQKANERLIALQLSLLAPR